MKLKREIQSLPVEAQINTIRTNYIKGWSVGWLVYKPL